MRIALAITALAVAACAPPVEVDEPAAPHTSYLQAVAERNQRALAYVDENVPPLVAAYTLCVDQETDALWQLAEPADTIAVAVLGNCGAVRNELAATYRQAYRMLGTGHGARADETMRKADEAARQRAISRVINRRAGRNVPGD